MLFSMLMPSGLLVYAAAAPQKPPARPAPKAGAVRPGFEQDILPLMKQFCVGCHSGKSAAAGLSLAEYKDGASVLKNRKVWENILQNVSAGHMPPKGTPHPTMPQRERFVAWIESTLSQADCKLDDPGRVTMRRLNRAEYNNTVRDLLGVSIRPADEFPLDDVGYGFDNIGDVLSLSPLLMEKYLSAADKVAKAAIVTPESRVEVRQWSGAKLSGDGGEAEGATRFLATNGQAGVTYEVKHPGEYTVRVRAHAQQAGNEPAKMAFLVDGKEVHLAEVRAVERRPEIYEAKVELKPGSHRIAAAFTNDFYQPRQGNRREQDRNLILHAMEIRSPIAPIEALPASHRRLITHSPDGSDDWASPARKCLAPFVRRAYRRPITQSELDRLVKIVLLAQKEGESYERGIQLAVQATLVSPHFLFRVEVDPRPDDPKAKRTINDFEMANRLSYFLWSSMPDETLMQLAAQGKLSDPKVRAAQVSRMLKDPKAQALAENFGQQWLTLRNLKNFAPDPQRFPTFSPALRDAMQKETELFFQAIVREDRSILEFLDSKFTYLNDRLAKHYGISGVEGDQFRKVTLADGRRGGLITQASILTVTSNPTRTSPVKRGKWVLEQIFGTPPPPPPPGVGELEEEKKGVLTGNLRQKMEQHRKNAICASCHARMDPIGFGLENYDAIGRWRSDDNGTPIDASGDLPDGKKFNGPMELKNILKAKKNLFVRSLSEKMLTYALGRGLETYDKCEVDKIAQKLTKNEYRFSALVTAVVESEPFRKRRGDSGK
jgi:hypothetical protein